MPDMSLTSSESKVPTAAKRTPSCSALCPVSAALRPPNYTVINGVVGAFEASQWDVLGPGEATSAVTQHHSTGNTGTYKDARKATWGDGPGRTGALPQPGRNSAAQFKIRPDLHAAPITGYIALRSRIVQSRRWASVTGRPRELARPAQGRSAGGSQAS